MMTAPTIDNTGTIQYPVGYTINPATGPLEEVTIPPGSSNIVTADVIAADLANVDIKFLQSLVTPPAVIDPNVSITDAEDKVFAADWERFAPTESDGATLIRIGDVLGHILGGTNATGDFLAKLITDELLIGRGTGYLGVRANLEAYHSTFFGPQAEQHGSMVHYLNSVSLGTPPATAYEQTIAESPSAFFFQYLHTQADHRSGFW
jgi:hypothetical protein